MGSTKTQRTEAAGDTVVRVFALRSCLEGSEVGVELAEGDGGQDDVKDRVGWTGMMFGRGEGLVGMNE